MNVDLVKMNLERKRTGGDRFAGQHFNAVPLDIRRMVTKDHALCVR